MIIFNSKEEEQRQFENLLYRLEQMPKDWETKLDLAQKELGQVLHKVALLKIEHDIILNKQRTFNSTELEARKQFLEQEKNLTDSVRKAIELEIERLENE